MGGSTRWRGSLHAVDAAEEVGEQLFFSGDDPCEFPDEGRFFWIVDGVKEPGFAAHEKEGGLLVDIGDEERGEEEVLLGPAVLECFEEAFSFFCEMSEREFLDLRDGEPFPIFLVDF